ncbi:carbamoyltransferase C-terminal domain-containing protein [Synechococcus sp. UW179B]|uniref:carbamoyltransferase C-terminal domain-containing protein n=1 Tax=Synechococcus sp. UW179B TaxID=2575516 RepID=UPI000E0E3E0C|nr:carbamoyltransferase C-terminal domain-containing protein [Synechococcus sp. UW179B]
MKILGIHASFNSKTHDPNIALLDNNTIVFAAEEERFLRYKSSSGRFPEYSIKKCLEYTKTNIKQIDLIAYDGITYKGLDQKIKRYIEDEYGYCPPTTAVCHPDAHIYAAYYFSNYRDAMIMSVDGYGDGITIRIAKATEKEIKCVKTFGNNCSLGDFYSAGTNYLGFKSIEGEYKVMGMAAYGDDEKMNSPFDGLIYFDVEKEKIMVQSRLFNTENYTSIYEPHYRYEEFKNALGHEPRGNGLITQEHFDSALKIQKAFCKPYIEIAKYYMKKIGTKKLILTGGCSLNTLANHELQKELNLRESLYVYPAASDRGLACGNALYARIHQIDQKINIIRPNTMALGVEYTGKDYIKAAERSGLQYKVMEKNAFYREAARAILNGKIIGWHKGRSEYGPRALGFRSILANAKMKGAKDSVNRKIKFREKYRPFAPAILMEDMDSLNGEYWKSPFMTQVFDVSKDKNIFSETVHGDCTARIQTVDEQSSPYLYYLMKAMKEEKEELPVLINTSFNLSGEPIVEKPEDAIRTFVSCELDLLYMDNMCIFKNR